MDLPEPVHVVGRHVLLINDDPLLLQAVGLMLRKAGHDVQTATSGEAGISAFEERLDKRSFDIALTDLGMPGIDGRTVALRIKAM